MRAARHLGARGLAYSLVALVPLLALYALFDAADHGVGAPLPTLARLAAITGQVAPVAACLGAIAAVASAATRGELAALAAATVSPLRVAAWAAAGALLVALGGAAVRAELGPRLARAWADGRPDPGAMQWLASGDPTWVRSGGALVRCADANCAQVWRATRTALVHGPAEPRELRALAARSVAPAMRLTTPELLASAADRRAAGLTASLLEVELWLRLALAALALLLPFGLAAHAAAGARGRRRAVFVAAAGIAAAGLAVATLAQGAAAGAWPPWLSTLPAVLLPLGAGAAAWLRTRRLA